MFTLVTSSKFFFLGLAEELNRRGLLESLVIGYPRFKLRNVPIPKAKIKTFPYIHALIVKFPRILNRLPISQRNEIKLLDFKLISKHARRISPRSSTFVAISSLGNDLFSDINESDSQDVIICRASRHILEQHRILSDASAKWNIRTELPSDEIISRELSEYDKARKIIVPSKICKESFVRNGIESNKVEVVYFPSNLKDFSNRVKLEKSDFIITFVGQVTLRKGICTLLEALAQLTDIDFKVNIVGPIDPNFSARLKGMRFNRNQINFQGHLDSARVREILSTTSVFVMPSIEEGWPMAMMEAISMGCIPLISDAICHLEELPIPDPSFLFSSENSVELAAKIKNLKQNQKYYQELIESSAGTAGLNRSWTHFVDDFLEAIS